MSVDSIGDLIGLQRVGRAVGLTLQTMKRQIRPGMTTAELDEIGRRSLAGFGARSAPRLAYDFPGSTCISINDEAAHGIPGNRPIRKGDLVNIDVSAELDGYYADTGASVAMPPTSTRARRLCAAAYRALGRVLATIRAGMPMNVIGKIVEAEARRSGFTVVRNLCGHGVGRAIHEEPSSVAGYYNARDRRLLTEGLVLAIEPFLSTGANHVVDSADGWTLKTPDGSLTAQYEHTLVITRDRAIVVTAV
ncbi:MAG: type I methionyl aminopeptidase [Planctomycetia bacterium]|nr:type I methionyl aminopeptidase [Planctomycetia bacterium]